MDLSYAERIAAVETELRAMRSEVQEVRGDVKTLLAAQNRQSGAAKLAAVIWGGRLALGGAIAGVFAARGH